MSLRFISTPCVICHTHGNSAEIYSANLKGEELNEKVFSARRFYDQKIHFRIVRCLRCGLWRSDPILEPDQIATLYRKSKFIYANHLHNLGETYGHYLKSTTHFMKERGRLLDIGCGNGFFLIKAKEQGFSEVAGVEPSDEAISQAPSSVRHSIKQGMFSSNLFPANYFDVISIFQTLEHFVRPDQVLKDCFQLLKPGGVVLAINHNIDALQVRLFGERSPVIDIEHIYFFNRKTMTHLFHNEHLIVRQSFSVLNRHSLNYFASLLPIRPTAVKDLIMKFFGMTRLGQLPIILPIGNVGMIAQKP